RRAYQVYLAPSVAAEVNVLERFKDVSEFLFAFLDGQLGHFLLGNVDGDARYLVDGEVVLVYRAEKYLLPGFGFIFLVRELYLEVEAFSTENLIEFIFPKPVFFAACVGLGQLVFLRQGQRK